MRLKVISDGTRKGSRVVDIKTGEEVEGVTGIEWKWSYDKENAVPQCDVTIASVPIEADMVNRDAVPTKDVL